MVKKSSSKVFCCVLLAWIFCSHNYEHFTCFTVCLNVYTLHARWMLFTLCIGLTLMYSVRLMGCHSSGLKAGIFGSLIPSYLDVYYMSMAMSLAVIWNRPTDRDRASLSFCIKWKIQFVHVSSVRFGSMLLFRFDVLPQGFDAFSDEMHILCAIEQGTTHNIYSTFFSWTFS